MAACLIFIRTGRHILQIPKNVRQKNKASDFRWKERRVKRALFALRGRMIVYLDLQVWIARLEEKKKTEREKKNRDFLQQSCDANKSRRWKQTRISPEKIAFISWRDSAGACRCNIVSTCVCFWFSSFIGTFCSLEWLLASRQRIMHTSQRIPRDREDEESATDIPCTPRRGFLRFNERFWCSFGFAFLRREFRSSGSPACRSLLGAAGTATTARPHTPEISTFKRVHMSDSEKIRERIDTVIGVFYIK